MAVATIVPGPKGNAQARAALASSALYEISTISKSLRRTLSGRDSELRGSDTEVLCRGMLSRIVDLSEATSACIDPEEGRDAIELFEVVECRKPEADEMPAAPATAMPEAAAADGGDDALKRAGAALLTASTMCAAIEAQLQVLRDHGDAETFPHEQAMQACIDKLYAAVNPIVGAPRAVEAVRAPDARESAQRRLAGANMARLVVDSLVSIEEQYLEREGTDKASDLTLAGNELDIAVQTALTQPDDVRDGFFLTLAALLVAHQTSGGFGEDWSPEDVLAQHGGATEATGAGLFGGRSSGAGETPAAAEAVCIPTPVVSLGRDAAWEIAALAQSIVEHSPVSSEDSTPLVVRGMAMRIAQLNSRLMAMLSDDLDGATPAEQERRMAQVVVGEAAAPARQGATV